MPPPRLWSRRLKNEPDQATERDLKQIRKLPIAALVLSAAFLTAGPSGQSQAADELATQDQKFSYAIGVQIGQAMKQRGYASTIDLDAVHLALEDVLQGRDLKLNEEQRAAVIFAVQQVAATTMANERLAAGQEFLKENGARDGVTTLDSGLQYEVLADGDGKQPTTSDTVKLHYEGKLIDGTVFDSSYQRNEMAEFPVGGLIPGFTEALLAMKTGSKWRVYIPSELGYGQQGAGRDIGPNEVLIFDIELFAIK